MTLNSNDFNLSTNDLILLQFYINYYTSIITKVTDTVALKLNNQERKDLENRFFQPMRLLQEIKGNLEIENNVMAKGKGWLILGYLQIFIFYDLGSIDPVQKIALKSKYIRENISEMEHLMGIETLQSIILASSLPHDRECARLDHYRKLTAEARDFDNFQTVRPSSSFQNLREEIENFSKNIGSHETILKQIRQLNHVAEQIQKKELLHLNPEELQEAIIWKKSLERFSGKLERNYLVGFPDLVSPMIFAISSLHHGVSILIHEISNLTYRDWNTEICYSLLRFPTVGLCQGNYLSLAKLCASGEMARILAKYSKSKSVARDSFEIAKMTLQELENLSFFAGTNFDSLWDELNNSFQKIRILWKEQEKQKEEEMKEKQSLFRTKTEKEEDEFDFRNMFPSFQQDFSELAEMFPGLRDPLGVQGTSEDVSSQEESFMALISLKDARKIQETHWTILRNSNRGQRNLRNVPISLFESSRNKSKKSVNNFEGSEATKVPNFIEPLAQRFGMLGSSIGTWPENLSSKLTCSLNVLIAQKSKFDIKKSNEDTYDFYRDPNIPEIEGCQSLVERLSEKIDGFLREWPENPILNSIKLIIERILNFSIESSLSRFLVGIELLLTKIQHWEENARFDVSLAEFIQSFGEEILRWRKLEISRWKDSLEVLEDDLRTEASKWWFFLFDLVDQYFVEESEEVENSPSKEKVIESLERFLAESPLVEFETRLRLIYLFYEHILHHYIESRRRRELSAMFWNVYHYYGQFLNDVGNKIKDLKEPLAKKVKDTIKITRWNDISYWSVKNTAEKTHRTVHKFVKEYKKGLKENVASYLVLKKGTESLGASSRRDVCPSDFLIDLECRKLRKIDKVTRKARQFCENIILRSSYSQIRKDVELFIEDTVEESRKLRNLEVDKTLTKGKQQAQLKSIVQQKKMALANYFKTLSQLGVSYRIGILTWKNKKSEITNFASTPLDLHEIQRFECNMALNENVETGLIEQWSSCNKYYYESLIKLNFLDGILNSGKSDLGMQNAERCRGFSVHLVLLAHRQKETIAAFFRHFLPFRIQLLNFISMDDSITAPNISKSLNKSNAQASTTKIVESIKSAKITDASKLINIVKHIRETEVSDISEFLEMLNSAQTAKEKVADSFAKIKEIIDFAKSVGVLDFSKIQQILETARKVEVLDFSQLIDILEMTEGNTSETYEQLDIPKQRILQRLMKNFQDMLEVLQMSMKQIIIVLESCPAESLAEENLLDLNETQIPILKQHDVVIDSVTSMKMSLNLVESIADEINSWMAISKRIERSGQIYFFHQRHIDFLQTSYQKISDVKKRLTDLSSAFTIDHPITENLSFMIGKINDSSKFFALLFNTSLEETERPERVKEYERNLDVLVTQVLLVVQRKLQNSQKSNQDPEKEAVDESFEDNFMTEKLIESLKKDIPDLRLKKISQIVGELLQIIYELDVKSANYCIRYVLVNILHSSIF